MLELVVEGTPVCALLCGPWRLLLRGQRLQLLQLQRAQNVGVELDESGWGEGDRGVGEWNLSEGRGFGPVIGSFVPLANLQQDRQRQVSVRCKCKVQV